MVFLLFLLGCGAGFGSGRIRLSHVSCPCLVSGVVLHTMLWSPFAKSTGGLWGEQEALVLHRELWVLAFTGV